MSNSKSSPSDRAMENACGQFDDPKVRAFNIIGTGMEILWQAFDNGNEWAGKVLDEIAERVVQAAGDKDL